MDKSYAQTIKNKILLVQFKTRYRTSSARLVRPNYYYANVFFIVRTNRDGVLCEGAH